LILIIGTRATPEPFEQMLEEHRFYIKLAVDIERLILAGGGEMHFDCEQALLDNGSRQENLWGADFMPVNQKITPTVSSFAVISYQPFRSLLTGFSSYANGRENRNVLPLFNSLSTKISPPCNFTRRWEIARPIPEPPG
jgi:hypothetical protein